jgi:NitT/TauT family transport system permease protein
MSDAAGMEAGLMSKSGSLDPGAVLEAVANEELPACPAARAMKRKKGWFQVLRPLSPRARLMFGILSFVLPIALWCAVSYVPFIWHPQVEITDPGSVDYLQVGMRMNKADFASIVAEAKSDHKDPPEGVSSNPIYLPAPHEVAEAMYTAFVTPPPTKDSPWLHQSLWHSIQIIFWGFVISSAIGVPLGILCGTYALFSRLSEPFVEFFRYLPAPAFGALAVAILGIYDGPKITIIVIGTLFQQILIIANTTRKLDVSLVEAAMTLGTRNLQVLWRVVIPGILPDLYRDQRILLGWAWTYLIVAELIGTTSGITWFITQQARYQHFANVYAAIAMIGIIGLGTDIVLALIGRRLFPWDRSLATRG